jgi:hypothetical protein
LDLRVGLMHPITYSVCLGQDRIYNFVACVGMLFTYFPEKYIGIGRESKMRTLKKIDWLGAILSISGITLL